MSSPLISFHELVAEKIRHCQLKFQKMSPEQTEIFYQILDNASPSNAQLLQILELNHLLALNSNIPKIKDTDLESLIETAIT